MLAFLFYNILFFIPDLLNIQRNSFYNFLDRGFSMEFQENKSIFWINDHLKISLYTPYYQLIESRNTIQKSIFKNSTFASKLYIPILH